MNHSSSNKKLKDFASNGNNSNANIFHNAGSS